MSEMRLNFGRSRKTKLMDQIRRDCALPIKGPQGYGALKRLAAPSLSQAIG
jgi:hypothetical protein